MPQLLIHTLFGTQPVKLNLDKKFFPKQKTNQAFNIDAQGLRKARIENPPTWEIGVTSKPVPVDLPMVSRSASTG